MAFRIETTAKTNLGLVRTNNEDSLFSADQARPGEVNPQQGRLYVVADGMGGVAAGEVASRLAAQAMAEFYDPQAGERHSGAELQGRLVQSLVLANERIQQHVRDNPECYGMGTTITALLLHEEDAILAHVGDSRAYLLRDKELYQISKDHSEVQLMVDLGRLTREQARAHPRKHILTQAVGVEQSSSLDIFTRRLSSLAGDMFLLCSDGLTDMVNDAKIGELLSRAPDTERAAQALVDAALTAGGRDNVTVIVIRLS